MQTQRFAYLKTMFGDRPIPVASRLHYAISAVEDGIVQELEEAIRMTVPNARVRTYMFDGLVIQVHEADVPSITNVLETVGVANRVRFTMKAFPVVDAIDE